jgi:hypothetical protein
MRKTIIRGFICSCLIFLYACSGSSVKTAYESEKTQIKMSGIQLGMTKQEVVKILGEPKKTEKKESADNVCYEIYYYMTKGKNLSQTELVKDNYTPLIFENGLLTAWGYAKYNYIFDVNNIRHRVKEEKRQAYTDDRDEWPSNEHKIILPPKSKAKTETKEDQQIEKAIIDVEGKDKKSSKKTKEVESKKPKPKPYDKDNPCKDVKKESENYHWWE